MEITVLLFAALRDALGGSQITVTVPEGATGRDVREHLAREHPQWATLLRASRLAQGVDFIDDDAVLSGEEVALIPPVSGGNAPPAVALTREPLDVSALEQAAVRPEAGALCVFLGTTRSPNRGQDVLHLEYEAHEAMALARMQAIVDEVEVRWGGARVWLHHRLGVVGPGEASVAIVVSTPHRADAFDACRHVIERVKQDVPIWKKEILPDGSVWVNAPGPDVV